jgi:multicomponent Na+:H+ antiporter subunit F
VRSWEVLTVVLVVLFAAGSTAVLRGETLDRVVGVQLAGVLAPITAVAIALASGRTVLLEVALALAVLTLAGSLVYARFLERWL